MGAELLLGIDMGTSSSKGVLVTPDGVVVATAVRAHSMSLPRPGWAEVAADQVWWGDVVALCQELLPQAAGAPVAGVCVSGVGPCLLPCDADGTALRPAILYGIDTRATAEIAERFADTDLATLARQGRGEELIELAQVPLGVAMLDDAMVAVTAGGELVEDALQGGLAEPADGPRGEPETVVGAGEVPLRLELALQVLQRAEVARGVYECTRDPSGD